MPSAWVSHDGPQWLPCRTPNSPRNPSFKPGSSRFCIPIGHRNITQHIHTSQNSLLCCNSQTCQSLQFFPAFLATPEPAWPTLQHTWDRHQPHPGSAINPSTGGDISCGSRAHTRASFHPITFFLHSHMKLPVSFSTWPVCTLPSCGLALPGLMATWSWFWAPSGAPSMLSQDYTQTSAHDPWMCRATAPGG